MDMESIWGFFRSFTYTATAVSPNHNTGGPSYVFYFHMVMSELRVSEYDVFVAALQRDGSIGCLDEQLDILYTRYAHSAGLPDSVGSFCKAVLEGKKPYKKGDGTEVFLA